MMQGVKSNITNKTLSGALKKGPKLLPKKELNLFEPACFSVSSMIADIRIFCMHVCMYVCTCIWSNCMLTCNVMLKRQRPVVLQMYSADFFLVNFDQNYYIVDLVLYIIYSSQKVQLL